MASAHFSLYMCTSPSLRLFEMAGLRAININYVFKRLFFRLTSVYEYCIWVCREIADLPVVKNVGQ